MIAVDTNILARAVVRETNPDELTVKQVASAFSLLDSGEQIFIPVTAIQELEWVLRGAYDMQTADIASIFEDILAVDSFVIDRAAAVANATKLYRLGFDFSDALHWSQSGLCANFASFDLRFAKIAAANGLQPSVTSPP